MSKKIKHIALELEDTKLGNLYKTHEGDFMLRLPKDNVNAIGYVCPWLYMNNVGDFWPVRNYSGIYPAALVGKSVND